jgi:hypothetical protein
MIDGQRSLKSRGSDARLQLAEQDLITVRFRAERLFHSANFLRYKQPGKGAALLPELIWDAQTNRNLIRIEFCS